MNIIPIPGFSEPISSLSHLVTAFAFLILGLKMIWDARGNWLRVSSLVLYIGCSVFLFSMSGVYHLLEKGTTQNYVLRILDHAGIYLMISGTFTPFQIILLRGFKRWGLLAIIWILAITGLTLTSIFFKTMPESLLLSFFVSMGWMSLFTVWFVKDVNKESIHYIFLGGVFYTIGAVCDFFRFPILINGVLGPHEFFHIFITIAAMLHLKGIYKISRLAISDKLVAMVKISPQSIKAYFTTEKAHFEAATDEEIRRQIETWVEGNYPEKLRPKKIKLKYFKEDHLEL